MTDPLQEQLDLLIAALDATAAQLYNHPHRRAVRMQARMIRAVRDNYHDRIATPVEVQAWLGAGRKALDATRREYKLDVPAPNPKVV